MQNLRRLIVCFVFAGCFALQSQADTLRVVTWNLHLFPSGNFNLRKPKAEGANVAKAAAVLRRALPHIILLQEVRDSASCVALIDSLDTLNYRVAVCSKFLDKSGIGTFQQVAIISRLPARQSYWKNWSTAGPIDPPRGFAYTQVIFENKPISVYSLHLKSNLAKNGQENQLNILKRELSIEELLRRINAEPKGKGSVPRIVVGGDMNTNGDDILFLSERTLTLLIGAGFTSCHQGLPAHERVTYPGRGRFPDATFDYIFAKGLRFLAPPLRVESDVSDHFAVVGKVGVGR